MGLDCSTSRKPLLDTISQEFLKKVKKKFPVAHQTLKSDISPIINTPILKIKDKTYLKLESHQTSGSFKIRGAFLYFQDQPNQQIVVASTGNFAKACFYAYKSCSEETKNQSEIFQQDYKQIQQIQSNEYNTPTPQPDYQELQQQQQQYSQEELDKSNLIIFVPKNVNRDKLKEITCPIIYAGQDCVESEQKARQYAEKHNCSYASPYNDINMILGSCTIGEEIDQYFNAQNEELDFIFVSCGGGGLIGGIALYFKYLKNKGTKIIGVQPKDNAAMYNILRNKGEYKLLDTLSDGTSGGVEENAITIEICKHLVDDWVLVKEDQILEAQLKLLNEHKLIVEGAAALAYAGFMNYPIGRLSCLIVLCGSNVDPHKIMVKK
ncbi:unnamed protein product (macronuclear) [Paramecium tetraurelia]|uniref:Tryptophan synthase beta chain-like PALP domain-containing protein n=1 Tax=Paramecium tetraurelia TaxID=5888 RepID=A0DW95_PARTE|nr:uncharacterized protein GSPATT00020953001 [Paramecium tetraurelia]CAK87312.1 unnamed protein product [Paramecium tetraurelia]|eukprot:XP_001454709.1 hypothetical protein (macronuclear) [Paramecium tetraurelia strain d4-2]